MAEDPGFRVKFGGWNQVWILSKNKRLFFGYSFRG